ncbi:MAG: BamA/TamA family outer membrane protein [Thermoanaerobaculia bacterium]|nr:BamA/TamA family outer membrane protein [Thermoanaerobaculia bacterium]
MFTCPSKFALAPSILLALLLSAVGGVAQEALPVDSDSPRESVEEDRNGWVFLPFLYYTPETSLAGGMATIYHYRGADRIGDQRTSSVTLTATYTAEDQRILTLRPDLYLGGAQYHLTADLVYEDFPDKFFGIGSDTPEGLEEDWTSEATRVAVAVERRYRSGWSWGPHLVVEDLEVTDAEPGGVLASGPVVGRNGGFLSALGLQLTFDRRDDVFAPRRGIFAQLSATFFEESLGSDFEFQRYLLDRRSFFPVGRNDVVALQSYLRVTRGEIPFYHLSELGGAKRMRGYFEGRFRDRDMAIVQAEYRLAFADRWDAVAFAGLGSVARSLGDFDFDVRPSAGGGLRYRLSRSEEIKARLDVGVGEEGVEVYVTLYEAF